MRRRPWWRVIKLPDLVRSDSWAEDEAVRNLDLRSAIERLDQGDQFALFTFFYLDLPESARYPSGHQPGVDQPLFRSHPVRGHPGRMTTR
jgi:hypothetical protein